MYSRGRVAPHLWLRLAGPVGLAGPGLRCGCGCPPGTATLHSVAVLHAPRTVRPPRPCRGQALAGIGQMPGCATLMSCGPLAAPLGGGGGHPARHRPCRASRRLPRAPARTTQQRSTARLARRGQAWPGRSRTAGPALSPLLEEARRSSVLSALLEPGCRLELLELLELLEQCRGAAAVPLDKVGHSRRSALWASGTAPPLAPGLHSAAAVALGDAEITCTFHGCDFGVSIDS